MCVLEEERAPPEDEEGGKSSREGERERATWNSRSSAGHSVME